MSSSPFSLNATIKYHLNQFLESNEAVVKRLLWSMYVNDVITGADSEKEVFELYTQAKNIFSQGGFNLRKYQTNSPKLQKRIDTAKGAPNPTVSADSTPAAQEVKVLGVTWNPYADALVFSLSDIVLAADDLHPIKRNIVSLVGKFYGLLAPVTIIFKILFQKLCQLKLDWDCDLPEESVESLAR